MPHSLANMSELEISASECCTLSSYDSPRKKGMNRSSSNKPGAHRTHLPNILGNRVSYGIRTYSVHRISLGCGGGDLMSGCRRQAVSINVLNV